MSQDSEPRSKSGPHDKDRVDVVPGVGDDVERRTDEGATVRDVSGRERDTESEASSDGRSTATDQATRNQEDESPS